jgi:hypothetical protein
MAAVLVTLTQAKAHLRITLPALDPGDLDLQLKLDQAEAIILDYLDTAADPTWVSPATAPGPVTASILLALCDLVEHRGDDTTTVSEKTWQAIERILVRSRTAAIA